MVLRGKWDPRNRGSHRDSRRSSRCFRKCRPYGDGSGSDCQGNVEIYELPIQPGDHDLVCPGSSADTPRNFQNMHLPISAAKCTPERNLRGHPQGKVVSRFTTKPQPTSIIGSHKSSVPQMCVLCHPAQPHQWILFVRSHWIAPIVGRRLAPAPAAFAAPLRVLPHGIWSGSPDDVRQSLRSK